MRKLIDVSLRGRPAGRFVLAAVEAMFFSSFS